MENLGEWPPTAADLYLQASPLRPVFQGDIFTDVPFTKARNGGSPDRDPQPHFDRRMVAILGHTCDLYNQATLTKVQIVAPVVDGEKLGIPEDWDGAFNHFPLPDLLGDGKFYAVDFRAAANIDASYLRIEQRIRSLSELGWAVFRQRMTLCGTRLIVALDDLMSVGAGTWLETELWQKWNEGGRSPHDFAPWLDNTQPGIGGFKPRSLLDRGMGERLRARLDLELRPSQE